MCTQSECNGTYEQKCNQRHVMLLKDKWTLLKVDRKHMTDKIDNTVYIYIYIYIYIYTVEK